VKNDNSADALERALAVLSNRTASSLALRTAAEQARAAVRAFDEASASAPDRRAQVLSTMKPPLANAVAVLEELEGEARTRALHGEIASAFAAQLDARALEAEKAELARDKERMPFAEQTQRVQELAERFAEYPARAARIVQLFVTDAAIRKYGQIAYGRVPPPQGSHVGYRRTTFRLPCVITTPEVLGSTVLPCVINGEWFRNFWPDRHGDHSWLEHAGGAQRDIDLDVAVDRKAAAIPRLSAAERTYSRPVRQCPHFVVDRQTWIGPWKRRPVAHPGPPRPGKAVSPSPGASHRATLLTGFFLRLRRLSFQSIGDHHPDCFTAAGDAVCPAPVVERLEHLVRQQHHNPVREFGGHRRQDTLHGLLVQLDKHAHIAHCHICQVAPTPGIAARLEGELHRFEGNHALSSE